MVSKADIRLRWSFVKGVFASRGYALLFVFLLAAYLIFNFWINRFNETLPYLLGFRLSLVLPYILLTLLIGMLVALNLTVIVYKLRQVMGVRKEFGFTAVGAFGGLLGGACPGCFVGVFPALAGAFGITATLGSLPFLGFEIQVPVLFVTGVALYFVAKPLTCSPDEAKKKGE